MSGEDRLSTAYAYSAPTCLLNSLDSQVVLAEMPRRGQSFQGFPGLPQGVPGTKLVYSLATPRFGERFPACALCVILARESMIEAGLYSTLSHGIYRKQPKRTGVEDSWTKLIRFPKFPNQLNKINVSVDTT